MFRRGTKRPRFSVGGHLVFEHDDSSNHSGLGMTDYEEDSSSQQHPTSTNPSDPNFLFGQYIPDRPRRAPKSITKPPPYDNTNLNACLDHLLRILSRKDKEGFFQYPVTDQFAPGYSQIITRPMDFSTMKKKISQDDYSNILEFRSDFELMCENAMKYNRPDTIYWQAAKKLLATGTKLMHKDKLISFRRSLECFSRLTERELGFRIDAFNHAIDEPLNTSHEQLDVSTNEHENLSSISVSQACSQRKPKLILKLPKFYEKVPAIIPDEEEEEDLSPEEILSQAQQAAQYAREKLALRRPISSYTLAYQHANGSTSLRFVNRDDFSQQTITLGELNHGSSTSTLPIVNENDKHNHLSSKYFLENGPFSSNATQYDSPFPSVSKEELDLLIYTYGSEFSAQYAVSLMDYVKDSGDLALAYVDRFLSVLTNGEHDNFMMKKREKQPKEEDGDNKIPELNSANNHPSTDSLPILTTDQIKLEPQINNTDDHIQHPNESINGYDLAEKDLFNLSDIVHIADGPEQIISSETIHHNLAIVNNDDSTFDTM